HRDADDRRHARGHARGGPAHEQPGAGRAAGGCGRDDRLVRQSRLGRRERQRDPRLRPEPAGGLTVAVHELDSPPNMLALYPKAMAGVGMSVVRKLPGLGGGERELPDDELTYSGLEIDREHLAAYDKVCGLTLREELPPT